MKTTTIITAAGMLIAPAILKVLPLGKDLGWASCSAQNVGISASGTVPNNSAMLDVVSDSRGMLIPRMTTAQRGTIPLPLPIGLEVFNTDCNNFNYWNGSCWVSTSKNLPAPKNITGSTDMCAGTVQAYSVTGVPGATYYNWSVPAGATFTGQGTLSISVTFGNFSGKICVTADNDCETSAERCKDVSISPIPNTPGNITGPSSVIPGQVSVNYFIASVSGASVYNWTVPPPGASQIISGAGTTSIMVNYDCAAISGNVTVTAQSACGTSAPATLAITVAPIIAVNAGVDKFAGVAIGGTATGGEGTYTYSWTPANNLSSYTVATPTALCTGSTTTYTETVTDANGCTANDAVVVTRNLTANAGANRTCNPGQIGGAPTASGGNNASYAYSWSPGTGLSSTTIANPTSTATSTITYTVTVTDANGCTANSSMTITLSAPPLGSSPATIAYTGALQTFTVPCGVTSLTFDVYGAQGGTSGGTGGLGGRAQGNLTVTPGATINVYVGGQGGWNGGGVPGVSNGYPGSYGGGASDIRVGGTALADRVIVAGGGGGGGSGGGSWSNAAGGSGGGTTGGSGTGCCGGPMPTGGTQVGGGAAGGAGCGNCGNQMTSGSLGVGGNGDNGCSSYGTGCGGGGGYYGGGGGESCGTGESGGGGSSYTGGVTGGSTTAGVRSGNGQITISY